MRLLLRVQRVSITFALICGGMAFWLAAPRSLRPSESMGTPEARKFADLGEQAMKAGDYLKAAEAYRKAIDLDRNFA